MDADFFGGVRSLNNLLREADVPSNDEVDILRRNLCVHHERTNITALMIVKSLFPLDHIRDGLVLGAEVFEVDGLVVAER